MFNIPILFSPNLFISPAWNTCSVFGFQIFSQLPVCCLTHAYIQYDYEETMTFTMSDDHETCETLCMYLNKVCVRQRLNQPSVVYWPPPRNMNYQSQQDYLNSSKYETFLCVVYNIHHLWFMYIWYTTNLTVIHHITLPWRANVKRHFYRINRQYESGPGFKGNGLKPLPLTAEQYWLIWPILDKNWQSWQNSFILTVARLSVLMHRLTVSVIMSQFNINPKRTIYPKMKTQSLSTHPHADGGLEKTALKHSPEKLKQLETCLKM